MCGHVTLHLQLNDRFIRVNKDAIHVDLTVVFIVKCNKFSYLKKAFLEPKLISIVPVEVARRKIEIYCEHLEWN
jgi:hypothetical protein